MKNMGLIELRGDEIEIIDGIKEYIPPHREDIWSWLCYIQNQVKKIQKVKLQIAIDSLKSSDLPKQYINLSIEALEKQIPKKPTDRVTSYDEEYGRCPNCNRGVSISFGNYCHDCGQKLDWREED